MTSLPGREELLARVEAATKGSRDLDIDLCLAFNYTDAIQGVPLNLRRAVEDPGWLDYEVVEDGVTVECTDNAPALTTSIDAALALVERVLPGWRYQLGGVRGRFYAALIWPDQKVVIRGTNAFGATLPLAIIAALLRATASQTISPATEQDDE